MIKADCPEAWLSALPTPAPPNSYSLCVIPYKMLVKLTLYLSVFLKRRYHFAVGLSVTQSYAVGDRKLSEGIDSL